MIRVEDNSELSIVEYSLLIIFAFWLFDCQFEAYIGKYITGGVDHNTEFSCLILTVNPIMFFFKNILRPALLIMFTVLIFDGQLDAFSAVYLILWTQIYPLLQQRT